MKKKHGFLRPLIIFLIAFFIIYASVTCTQIVSFGRIDEKTNSDAIIVLGAGSENGVVSAVFRERLNHGIWLYENGFADHIIITGGVGKGQNTSDALAGKNYVLSFGIPENAVFIEETSVITEQNLENAKAIMDEFSLKNAIVVSDPLHMKRAMLMAQDYGISAVSSPTPTSAYRSFKTRLPFLLRECFMLSGYRVVRIFK